MKKTIYTLMLLFPLWGLGGCDKDDDNNCQGIDCLPPATQTGTGTFGCLVNGEPYVDNSGNFNCFYQFVDGEYFFNISAKKDVNNIDQIRISSNMSQIDISTINLNENSSNEFYAEIGLLDISGDFTTSAMPDGTVTFTEFNTNSRYRRNY